MTRVAGVVVLYRTPVNGTVLVKSRNDSETIVSKTKRENRAQGKRSGWEKRDEKRVTLFSFQDSVGWDISSGKAESSGKGNASPIFRKTRVKLEDWRARARDFIFSHSFVSALFFERAEADFSCYSRRFDLSAYPKKGIE